MQFTKCPAMLRGPVRGLASGVLGLALAAGVAAAVPAPARAGSLAPGSGYASVRSPQVPDDTWLPAPNETPSENGLALTPPMGYTDWNQDGCDIDQQTFTDAANTLLKSGLAKAGYRYVDMDDCWPSSSRDASGNLVANPAEFPSGMQWLGSYLHKRGLKFGIYEDAGTETCAGYPGSYGHYQQDADTFASWGVDLLKLDGCNLPSISGETTDQVLQTLYTQMSQALQASGRPVVYLESAPVYATDYSDAMSWIGQEGNAWYSEDDGSAASATYAGPGHWNYYGTLLPQDTSLTTAQREAQFSMAAELASPLIFSADMTTLTRAQAAIISNPAVIAVDQDSYGAQGTAIATQGNVTMWAKPLADGDISLVFQNQGDTTERASLTASQAGFSVAAPGYALDNLWTHQVTESAGTIAADVPPGGVVMYRVTPLRHATPAIAPSTDVAVTGSGFSTGATKPVTVTVTDNGLQPLDDVRLSLRLPSGWTSAATSPVSTATVQPGGSASATFSVTAGTVAAGGDAEFGATASYRAAPVGRRLQATGQDDSPSLTPYSALSDAFNNVAITDESDTTPADLNGGFDGEEGSFAQQALDSATAQNGALLSDAGAPGSTINYQGTVFTMPDAAAGTPDNVSANGQIIALNGTGAAVALLVSGAGATSGTVTVNYADGTSSSATVSVPSWYYHGQSTGGAVPLVQSQGKDAGKGYEDTQDSFDLYDVTIPVTPGETVASVVLPEVSAFHVFSVAMAPQLPVSPVFTSFARALDNVAITDESDPDPAGLSGGFDGGNDTFDQESLDAAAGLNGATLSDGAAPGSTITYDGATLTMPDVAAGTPDNVAAADQTIDLSGTGSSVLLLASGAGATTGTVTVTYADGTTSTASLSLPSWYYHGQSTGGAVPVVQSRGRNKSTGPANTTDDYDLYALAIPVVAGEAVASITLPNNDLFHVFAATVAP